MGTSPQDPFPLMLYLCDHVEALAHQSSAHRGTDISRVLCTIQPQSSGDFGALHCERPRILFSFILFDDALPEGKISFLS